jgi:hypothetical protein
VLVALSGFMRFSRVECYCPPFYSFAILVGIQNVELHY